MSIARFRSWVCVGVVVLVLVAGCAPPEGTAALPGELGTAVKKVPLAKLTLEREAAPLQSDEEGTTREASLPQEDTTGPGEVGSGHPITGTSVSPLPEGRLGSTGLPEADITPVVYYPREDSVFPEELVNLARQDLAQWSDLDNLSIIMVVKVEPVTWPDASLGAATGGVLQVLTPGFRILLSLHDATHTYHTDLERVVYYGQTE